MIAWARGPAEEQLNQLSAVGPTTSGPSRTLIGFDSKSFRECVGQFERIQQQLAVHLICLLYSIVCSSIQNFKPTYSKNTCTFITSNSYPV